VQQSQKISGSSLRDWQGPCMQRWCSAAAFVERWRGRYTSRWCIAHVRIACTAGGAQQCKGASVRTAMVGRADSRRMAAMRQGSWTLQSHSGAAAAASQWRLALLLHLHSARRKPHRRQGCRRIRPGNLSPCSSCSPLCRQASGRTSCLACSKYPAGGLLLPGTGYNTDRMQCCPCRRPRGTASQWRHQWCGRPDVACGCTEPRQQGRCWHYTLALYTAPRTTGMHVCLACTALDKYHHWNGCWEGHTVR
jgi:hypothetical protein